MSRIGMIADENNVLTLTKVLPETGSDNSESAYMSRREFLDFARWLKYHVTEDEFPYEPKVVRTMFNRATIDGNEKRRNIWKRIKEMRVSELYENLSILLINYSGDRCAAPRHDRESLFEIPVYYEEDLCTVLTLYGLEEECSKDFADMAAAGYYKYYCKEKDETEWLSTISKDLHDFCCAAGGLPNRRMLIRFFPEQYERFLSEKEQKGTA